MNIQRHHTYAAYLLSDLMLAAGEPAPDVNALELDYAGTVAQLQAREAAAPKDLADRIARLMPSLRQAADWPGG